MVSTGLPCFILVLVQQFLLMTCRTAGEVFSVCLAQGGPEPCFFRNWCFQFLVSGDFDTLQLTKDDVDDQEYSSLIERVNTPALSSFRKQ